MAVEVDGYDVLERIGRGGAGTVYLARQRSLDRLVALKILDVGGGVTPDRFLREAQVLAQIRHPHLVDVIDHGMSDGQPWYAMRYCGGGSVSEILARDCVLTPGAAVTIGASVAEALAALHDRGIVHRDVKPANVFLTDEGDVLLGDLGVAFSLESDRVTTSGQVLGTMGYTAPELLSGLAPSPATDVFALGVMLYELVSGQKPFRGAHPAAVIDAIGKGRWPPLAEVAPEAPPALVVLVEQALAGEPASRPGDLRVWADELRWALREAGDRPSRVEPITTRIDPSMAGSGDTSPAPPPRTRDLTPGSSPRNEPTPAAGPRPVSPGLTAASAAAGAPPIATPTPLGATTPAASSTTISTTPPLAGSSDSMPVARRSETATSRKRPALLLVGAVVVLALIAGVAMVMAGRGDDDGPAAADGGRVLPAELSAKASVTAGLATKAPADEVVLDASWEIVGTEGVRGFTTLRNTGDEPIVVAHDEIIPKELVADVSDLATDPPWAEVIDPDPIVRFCLRLEPGDAVEITWWSLEPAMGLDQATLDGLAEEWSATYDEYEPADPVESCADLYEDEELDEIAAAAEGETTTSTDADDGGGEDSVETTEVESSVPETTAFPDADGDGVADIFDAVDDRAAPTTTRVITTTVTTRPAPTPAPTTAAPTPAPTTTVPRTTTTTRPPATTTTRPPTTTAPTTAPPPTTAPNTVTLPNFIGGSRDTARNWIINNGLIWDQRVTGNASPGTPQFAVVGQSPSGGTTVTRGSIVTVTSYDPDYCPPSNPAPDCV